MMLHARYVLAAGLLAFLSPAVPAHSAVIIEIQDASLPAGGVGTVDLLIHSSDIDLLQLANFRVQITQLSGSGDLQFQGTFGGPDVPQQMSFEQQSPQYVFFSDTATVNFSAARQDPNLQELVGGDFTLSGGNVTLTGANRLLARLELQHVTPTPAESSGTYSISLVQDLNNTFFVDDGGAESAIDASSFTNSGTITVTAVPEPASMGICAAGLAAAFLARRSRKRSTTLRNSGQTAKPPHG